jgi:uridine kinase
MLNLASVIETIVARRQEVPSRRSVLVGVTGIDGSGKGYVAKQLVMQLREKGCRVAALGVDGWLNLPPKRFDLARPAEHFYEHALRFDELFGRLILPLQANRSCRVTADHAEETANAYRRVTYAFQDIDVIVLEGIYLLKRAFRHYFDLSFWVDCTFETALERAAKRSQEGLSPTETIRVYQTIYFPAQRIHFTRDNPRATASAIIPNDPRISSPSV